MHRIIDHYNPQTKSEYEDKERNLNILNAVKNFILYFYLNHDTITKMIQKH